MPATTFYAPDRAPSYTPPTWKGAWDDTAGAVTRALDLSAADGGIITAIARGEASATNPYRVALLRLVSAPLAAQTLSGTLQVVFGVKESSTAANDSWHVHAYFTEGDSDAVRDTALADYDDATEWPTGGTGRSFSSAQAVSGTCQEGDRLVIEIGFIAANASTSNYTGTLYYGTQALDGSVGGLAAGSTAVTAQAGSVTFSGGVDIPSGPVDVTRLSARTVSLAGDSSVDVSRLSVRTVSEIVVAVPVDVTRLSVRTVSLAGDSSVDVSRLSVRTVSRLSRPTPARRRPTGRTGEPTSRPSSGRSSG